MQKNPTNKTWEEKFGKGFAVWLSEYTQTANFAVLFSMIKDQPDAINAAMLALGHAFAHTQPSRIINPVLAFKPKES